MNMSKTYKNCVIIGEDIDLLVILIALSPSDKEIFFLKPGRNKVLPKMYSSRSLDKKPVLKANTLLLHAFSGCDTTSSIFGKGKLTLWELMEKKSFLLQPLSISKKQEYNQK